MSTPRSRPSASLSLFLAAALAAPAAHALKTDRDQPLNVSSNTFQADQAKHLTVLTGAVKLDQGTIKGEADKGTVHQNENNEIVRVVLDGKPAKLDQKLDDGGMMRSSAKTIDYNNDSSTAILTGNAIVIQEGRGTFKAERIVYNTESGEITGGVEGGGGRVTMQALPQPKKADAAKPAATPAPDKKP